MAQAEHLPIYKASYDLCLYLEQVVRGFSRYHKYTLGADLRGAMMMPRTPARPFNPRHPTVHDRQRAVRRVHEVCCRLDDLAGSRRRA